MSRDYGVLTHYSKCPLLVQIISIGLIYTSLVGWFGSCTRLLKHIVNTNQNHLYIEQLIYFITRVLGTTH